MPTVAVVVTGTTSSGVKVDATLELDNVARSRDRHVLISSIPSSSFIPC